MCQPNTHWPCLIQLVGDCLQREFGMSGWNTGAIEASSVQLMERALLILAWQQKQTTAAVFATLDEAFGSDWTSVQETDFQGMI